MMRHFLTRNGALFGQFGKYLIVGGIAFVFDFSTLFLLTELASIPYLTSAALAFVVGLNVNYFLAKLFVFKNSKIGNRKQEYMFVFIISVSGLFLNQVIIWTCTEFIGIHYLISKLFSTAIILVYNFSLRKIFIFA